MGADAPDTVTPPICPLVEIQVVGWNIESGSIEIVGKNKGVRPALVVAEHPFASVTVRVITDGAPGITIFMLDVVSFVPHK